MGDRPIDLPKPVLLSDISDLSWVPDLTEIDEPAMSAEEYVQAYLSNSDEWWWSTAVGYVDPWDVLLKRVIAVLSAATLPKDQSVVEQLGAGALEGMLSHEVLDQLTAFMPFNPVWRLVLENVWAWDFPDLDVRLKAMLRVR